MDFADYQRLALRTYKAERTPRHMLTNGALGLAGESGEVADIVKKLVYPSKAGDGDEASALERITDELGDVLWYIAILAQGIGVSLEEIARHNIEKLAARHNIDSEEPL